MRNKLFLALMAATMTSGIIAGCTPDARDKYSDASQSASDATKKTGDAMATDAKETTQAVADNTKAAGDAVANGAKVAGQAVANTAENTGAAVANGAKVAGQAVQNTAENAGKAVGNVDLTGRVKSAMLSANGLKTNNLNVDTKDNQVILRGSVPNEAQKKQAEEIAKSVAGANYTITDQLTIGS